MELIPYSEFAKLRMKQFAQVHETVSESDGWEWMGGVWINEALGACTSISRLEELPDEAGGLEIDFRDLPPDRIAIICDTIHLPLRPGMTLEAICSVLGKPEETHVFGADRKNYDFTVGSRDPYHVSVIAHETDGLIYIAVVRKDVLAKCHD